MENNIETNQDNGRGIFYAVIGVATLVITLIGATFAYLTASTNSDPGAVTATGAKISLGYSDVKTGLKTNLIPIDTDLSNFAKTKYKDPSTEEEYYFSGINVEDCRDVNKNNICSVYQFTISNPESADKVAQYVYASFEVVTNTFENLHFAVFKGTDQEIKENLGYTLGTSDVAITALTEDYEKTGDPNKTYTKDEDDAERKHVIANKGDLVVAKTKIGKRETASKPVVTFDFNNQLNQLLDDKESMTYTIILWVDEINSAQDGDQSASFQGTVKFTTEGNSTGVTGNLSF